jgi:hypothetical protein
MGPGMKRALLVLLAASCGPLPGERASGDDDCDPWLEECDPYAPDAAPPCPSGEICSPETPEGLWFGSDGFPDVPFSNPAPRVTAAGGTQTITIYRSPSTEFAQPFEAASSDPGVLVIELVDPPVVRVRAVGPGAAYLRILEPGGTGLLYDRFSLTTARVTRASLAPAASFLTDSGLWEERDPWALLAGGEVDLVIRLWADDQRVADESALAAAATPARVTASTPEAYVARLAGVAPGDGRVDVTVGDLALPVSFRVVSAVDSVGCWSLLGSDEPVCPSSVTVGHERQQCLRALSGGDVVLGAGWSYTATPRLALIDEPLAPSCVRLSGVTSGAATLTATAAGVAAAFPIDVVASAARPAPAAPARSGPAAGERSR